ncbi:MAG TPA: class I SAM-dependent methyltransferase [Stellaceae bacterium]|nr:class I SAM-dependent methyltransferase [Stellaceae bacterium]
MHYQSEAEHERSSKQFMRRMVDRLPAPARILDVGCGTGLNASFLRAMGHHVIGIDVSSVAIAKFRAKGFEGLVGDMSQGGALPLETEVFDALYASEVIEHCADTGALLGEFNRVLKPGGVLFLSTPNSAFWPYRILGVLGRTPSEYQHPGHVRFFSLRSLARAVTDAGFTIDALSGRNMFSLLGKRIGDPIAPLLRLAGFAKEARFATGDHFWQFSRFAPRASAFWSDTLIVVAKKRESQP